MQYNTSSKSKGKVKRNIYKYYISRKMRQNDKIMENNKNKT